MNLQMYYNKRAGGGRSLVARIIDAVLFRAAIFCTLFVILFYYTFSLTFALIMSVLLTTAASLALTLYRRAKRKKFEEKDLEDLKEKCLLEELTFMSIEEFSTYINKLLDSKLENIKEFPGGFKANYKQHEVYAMHNHPGDVCSVSDVLNIYRGSKNKNKLIILTMSSFSDEAAALCKQKDIECIGGKKVLRIAASKDLLVSEEKAQEKAELLMKESLITLKQLRKNALSGLKIRGYIICGIIALVWPLINGFKIYYPIISIACFALAAISYKKRDKAKESTDIGIS